MLICYITYSVLAAYVRSTGQQQPSHSVHSQLSHTDVWQ